MAANTTAIHIIKSSHFHSPLALTTSFPRMHLNLAINAEKHDFKINVSKILTVRP